MLYAAIKPPNPLMLLDYVDAQGDASHRPVQPIALIGEFDEANRMFNASHLLAWCQMRRGERTFRLDRVDSLAYADTGEVIGLTDWVKRLAVDPSQLQDHLGEPAPIPTHASLPAAIASPVSRSRWRWIALAIGAAYLIGRLRVIPAILHHFHQHWGLWL